MKANESCASGFDRKMITNLADHVRKQYKLKKSNVNLNDIVKSLNGKILFEDPSSWENEQTASLKTYSKEESFEIIVSKYLSKEARTYAIAHELGHFILHSNLGKESLEFSLYGDGILEDEADAFAYNLLMPKKEFIKAYDKNNPIELMVIYFNVPLYIIKNRIINLDL